MGNLISNLRHCWLLRAPRTVVPYSLAFQCLIAIIESLANAAKSAVSLQRHLFCL